MSESDIKLLKDAAAKMAAVLDDLIRQFHRNPMQPNIGNTVVQADGALAGWNSINTETQQRVATPNDPKLSERRVRRDGCAAGGKAEAGSSRRDAPAGSLQRMVSRSVEFIFGPAVGKTTDLMRDEPPATASTPRQGQSCDAAMRSSRLPELPPGRNGLDNARLPNAENARSTP